MLTVGVVLLKEELEVSENVFRFLREEFETKFENVRRNLRLFVPVHLHRSCVNLP